MHLRHLGGASNNHELDFASIFCPRLRLRPMAYHLPEPLNTLHTVVDRRQLYIPVPYKGEVSVLSRVLPLNDKSGSPSAEIPHALRFNTLLISLVSLIFRTLPEILGLISLLSAKLRVDVRMELRFLR